MYPMGLVSGKATGRTRACGTPGIHSSGRSTKASRGIRDAGLAGAWAFGAGGESRAGAADDAAGVPWAQASPRASRPASRQAVGAVGVIVRRRWAVTRWAEPLGRESIRPGG